MRFSVVIPIHNSEKYLNQCIESVLIQDYDSYEIVLVNDGSTDSSKVICEQYESFDDRIKVINLEKGHGAAYARNVGTREARGDYIIYLDSDDYILSNTFLSKLNDSAKNSVDIICYKFRKYFEETKGLNECSFSIPGFSENMSYAERINNLVKNDAFYCAPWTKAIRRGLLFENGIKFEEGLLSEDQEWYYHVIRNADTIGAIDESFIAYRQHKDSTSVSWTMKNLTDTIYIMENLYLSTNAMDGDELQEALFCSIAKLYCNLLIGYVRFTDKEKTSQYNRIKDLSILFNYHTNPRVKVFYMVNKAVGFRALLSILKIIS